MTIIETRTDRRSFLKGMGAASLGLVVGFHFDPRPFGGRAMAAAAATEFVTNAFIRIAPDNLVTVYSMHIEVGQGSFTAAPTVIVDELVARPDHRQAS